MLNRSNTTDLPNQIAAPGLIGGNTFILSFTAGLAAVDTTLYTVTGGKTFYLQKLIYAYTVTAVTSIFFRDGNGGAQKIPLRQAIATGTTLLDFSNSPIPFSTSVYYDYVSGTITANDITLIGYEK